jgi:hypothetical protein
VKLKGSLSQVLSTSPVPRRAREIGKGAAPLGPTLFVRSGLEEAGKTSGKVTLVIDSAGLLIRRCSVPAIVRHAQRGG